MIPVRIRLVDRVGSGGRLAPHVEPVHVGQIQVETNVVVWGAGKLVQCLSTVESRVHCIAITANPLGECAGQIALVLDDKELSSCASWCRQGRWRWDQPPGTGRKAPWSYPPLQGEWPEQARVRPGSR